MEVKHMNQRLSLSIVVGLALFGLVAWGGGADETSEKAKAEATTSVFEVTGMTCGGCEVGVRRVVKKLEGVEEVEASHKEGTTTVTYDPEQVGPEDIIEAIEELGYTAELQLDEDTDA
jgi:copper chaperone CopZ